MHNLQFLIQLKDLQYEYSGSFYFLPQEKKYKNMPNNEAFNRFNRYEMILLIHALQVEWNLRNPQDCLKVERLIREVMPASITTQTEIADWLVVNWNFQAEKYA